MNSISIIYIYHNWFSNSFIEGYLDYPLCKIFFSFLHKHHQWKYLNISWPVFMSISIVKFLELKSLGQEARAFKNFLSIINLPSKKALTFYTPTNGIWEWAMFSFPRIWLEQFEDIHFNLLLLLQAPSQSFLLLMWLKGLVVLVGAKEKIQQKMSCRVAEIKLRVEYLVCRTISLRHWTDYFKPIKLIGHLFAYQWNADHNCHSTLPWLFWRSNREIGKWFVTWEAGYTCQAIIMLML